MRGKGVRRESGRPLSEPSSGFEATGCHRRPPGPPGAAPYCLIGFLGGMFGGLLGIGGGSVIAPLLLVLGSLRPAQVSGTTLATVLVISLVGSGAYASLGHLDLHLAWPIALGSVVGAVTGSLSAKRLSMRLMLAIFILILPYFAIKELWPSFAAPSIGTNLLSLGLLGFATGLLSGLLGISGASLVVPSLVGFFLIDHHAAQGIAMSVALADSAAGTVIHARARNVHYPLLLYLAIPALFASVAGAFLSHFLPGSVLRNVFGILVVAVWLMILARISKDYLRGRVSSVVGSPSGSRMERSI